MSLQETRHPRATLNFSGLEFKLVHHPTPYLRDKELSELLSRRLGFEPMTALQTPPLDRARSRRPAETCKRIPF
jgi:hypothetical protein